MVNTVESILLNYRASLHNNFEGNDESLKTALKDLEELIKAEVVGGGDAFLSDFISTKQSSWTDKNGMTRKKALIRDELRAEQLTNLTKVMKG